MGWHQCYVSNGISCQNRNEYLILEVVCEEIHMWYLSVFEMNYIGHTAAVTREISAYELTTYS
jgi:hypothetical protein